VELPQASHLLPAHEKLCIRSGETLQLQAPPRALGSDGVAHTGVITFVQEKGDVALLVDARNFRIFGICLG